MEFSPELPATWTDREWLAFLLLLAAEVDGVIHAREMRLLHVELGREAVDRMHAVHAAYPQEKRDLMLKESLPFRLPSPKSRQKVQQVLRKLVMADGEYSREEQQLIKRVTNWLRTQN
ncbi:MAG TPA: TerB family tellurite resistance protein [Bacteroidetes bacterium]|nr:TerB family tellurite resistance protein [Bacteroidota bacterium]